MKAKTIISVLVCLIVAFLAVSYAWYVRYVQVDVPLLKSDVPIVYKISWWPNQDALRLDGLSAVAVYDELNVFNGTSVIEYGMKGSLSGKKGWRPYIRAVHLSERWDKVSDFEGGIASIVVTPIVGIEKDSLYAGEQVNFDVSVQDYLDVAGWGENIFTINSLDKVSVVKLPPRK